jgi:hypothetical protein
MAITCAMLCCDRLNCLIREAGSPVYRYWFVWAQQSLLQRCRRIGMFLVAVTNSIPSSNGSSPTSASDMTKTSRRPMGCTASSVFRKSVSGFLRVATTCRALRVFVVPTPNVATTTSGHFPARASTSVHPAAKYAHCSLPST